MRYRRPTQLALQATLLLAAEPEGTWRRVRDLAAALGVSVAYLTKVLQALSRVGLVRALRGVGHGVQLARPPKEIRLWEILSAIEPAEEFDRCFLGLPKCDDANPCPLHPVWAPIRSQMFDMLQCNLAEFVDRTAGEKPAAWPVQPRRQPGACRSGSG